VQDIAPTPEQTDTGLAAFACGTVDDKRFDEIVDPSKIIGQSVCGSN
jgi:hypothetical protein